MNPNFHDFCISSAVGNTLWFQKKKKAGKRTRTVDLLITNQLHYQLCYPGNLRLKAFEKYFTISTS